jgi:hypothetical protein
MVWSGKDGFKTAGIEELIAVFITELSSCTKTF